MWRDLALLIIAGAIGTVSRFLVTTLALRWCGAAFPWGTVFVNLVGCFLFGLIWSITEGRLAMGSQARLVLLTGFMGAFTTFSTFAFETCQMLLKSQFGPALGNCLGQVALGLVLMFAGLAIGRQF